MTRIVVDYHPAVGRTAPMVARLIQGTAFFPGGTGLWRGDGYFGPDPQYFPECPVMFVGHNFDSIEAHEASQSRGGEVGSFFWKILKGYLHAAALSPEECFFTNVLMGLKPGSALGPMPSVPGYQEQCLHFFLRQVAIVRPRAIVALGNHARALITKAARDVRVTQAMHPSAREFKHLSTRAARVAAQGVALREFLANTLACS